MRWMVWVAAGCRSTSEPDDRAQTDSGSVEETGAAEPGVVGPEGGTVEGPDGVVVIVPAGAVDAPVAIGIAVAAELPPEVRGFGLASAVYELTPHDTTFLLPVTVRLPYDPALAPDPIVVHAPVGGDWTEVPGANAVSEGFVEAEVDGFSLFGAGSTVSFTALSGTCGLSYLGEVWCWSATFLGDGGFRTLTVPTRITQTPQLSSLSVSGPAQLCGIGPLERAYCMGETVSSSVTALAEVDPDSALSYAKVTVGGQHACGIALTTGWVYCWGDNTRMQLGTGVFGSPRTLIPARIASDLSFVDLDAGGNHTCGITTTSDVVCWGDNLYGQIGGGVAEWTFTPTVVATGYLAISAGSTHTCAVGSSGVGACWGDNGYGQIGDGTAGNGVPGDPNAVKPLTEIDGFTWFVDLTGRSGLVAGGGETCGRASSSGTWCWGNAARGAIGDGGPVPASFEQPEPTKVANGLDLVWLSVGTTSCGIDPVGQTWCWGDHTTGGLGDGTPTDGLVHATPVRVKMSELR